MLLVAQLPYLQVSLGFASIADGLAVVEDGGYLRLLFASRDDTRLGSVLLAEGQEASATAEPQIGQGPGEDIAIQTGASTQRAFVFSTYDGLLRQAPLGTNALPGLTKPAATSDGLLFGVTAMEMFELGETDLAVIARKDRAGLAVYQMNAAGEMTRVATIVDGPKAYLGDTADLAALQIDGRNFLVVASPLENGLTLYEVSAAGLPTFVDAIGALNGLPIAGPAALQTVQVAGLALVVLAATGSSSISVLRVNAAGVMFQTDHMVDDRTSRFADVAALDVFDWAGRSFIVAAGTDAGLSVIELLPDGTLSHVVALAMETGAGLANVTGIETAVIGSAAAIFLTDARGDRIHRVDADLSGIGGILWAENGAAAGGPLDERILGSAGADSLQGGAGADYLHDGAGADTLTGGGGADVFVFARDGVADRISDFQPGIDKIDVSDWGRIYSASALSLVATSTGAILDYWTENLTVTRATGGSLILTEADFLF